VTVRVLSSARPVLSGELDGTVVVAVVPVRVMQATVD
jgi:hypothetical protein